MARSEPTHCDVLVIARDAAGLFAALDCARIGLLTEVWITSNGFLARQFSNRDGVIVSACEELGLEYLLHQPNRTELEIAGIPVNPFSLAVRQKVGWSGAWRIYLDRLKPVLKIGNETRLDRLVAHRLGNKALTNIVNPRLIERYGMTAEKLTVDAVAPGLAQSMTRAGSLTGGALELIVQDGRNAQSITVVAGGEAAMMQALREKLAYFAAGVREVDASTIDIDVDQTDGKAGSQTHGKPGSKTKPKTIRGIKASVKGRRKLLRPRVLMGYVGLDVPTELQEEFATVTGVVGKTDEQPGLESAIPASRQTSLHLRTAYFSGGKKPPIGSASNQE